MCVAKINVCVVVITAFQQRHHNQQTTGLLNLTNYEGHYELHAGSHSCSLCGNMHAKPLPNKLCQQKHY
jgi:hypothetical protein